MALGLLVVLSVACDKKSGDSTPAAAAANYTYVNGACYDTTTNTQQAANLCANVLISGAYRYDGVTCRDSAGNAVTTTLCTNGIYSTSNTQYHLNGVTCVDVNNNPVAQSLCTQAGVGNGYQILGGNCIQTYTGQVVSYSYCTGVAGYNPNQCSGIFLKYLGYGMTSYLYCQGSNCSGQTLIEYTTGVQKVCP
ncbi:MAG: hypothetical protein B7Y39_13365 [Bdellovibrio sp. 28-41-41]|nr:MAG: hypothetical protein B7Y39_13365 [Bdellovibrio sp. 28-41-41]